MELVEMDNEMVRDVTYALGVSDTNPAYFNGFAEQFAVVCYGEGWTYCSDKQEAISVRSFKIRYEGYRPEDVEVKFRRVRIEAVVGKWL